MNGNVIIGTIGWHQPVTNNILEKCRYSNGILDLYVYRIHCFSFSKMNIYHNEATNVTCAIIGYISNLEEIKSEYEIELIEDVKIVGYLYKLKGPGFIKDLEGLFTIIILDNNNQKIYIFRDAYGSNIPLYYYSNKNIFIFSTRLKEVLKRINHRELNISAASDFLYFRSIIPNEYTLVKDIYKLIRNQSILIDYQKSSYKIHYIKFKKKKISKASAKKNLIKSIETSITKLSNSLISNKQSCTLSGGFDTNLVLELLAKNKTPILTAVSIGGELINEIPQAKQSIALRNNIKHLCKVVKPDKLTQFPDIVWKVEGYVFDPGLFLQHELANLLVTHGLDTVFLGECADQQFTLYKKLTIKKLERLVKRFTRPTAIGKLYLKYIMKSKHRALTDSFAKFSSRSEFDIDFDFILKKSGIMLNSQGVQGLYPFLNTDLEAVARALGRMNKRKKYYKNEVTKFLGRKKAKHIKKIGGTTDIELLFKNKQKIIETLFYSEFARKLLRADQINDICSQPQEYLLFVLHFLFIFLFNELFISGKYDLKFDQSSIYDSLDNFIKC